MNEETSEQVSQDVSPVPFLPSFWNWMLYAAFIIAAPIFNFTFVDVFKPDWQSGKTSDYINLFLSAPSLALLFPLAGLFDLLLHSPSMGLAAMLNRSPFVLGFIQARFCCNTAS